MKILVVDDRKEDRYLLETILQKNGYSVVSAENGKKALEILNTEKIDIIISDILMPEMDGYTLCSICKSNERFKNIPFVFYTATYTSPDDEKLGLGLGADFYIKKPIEIDEFIDTIKRIMDEYSKKGLQPRMSESRVEENLMLYNKVLIEKLDKKCQELDDLKWHYELVCEHIDDFIFWLDKDGYFTRVNCTIEIFGYKPEDAVGKHFTEFLTPKSQLIAREYFARAKMGETFNEYTVEVIKKDGSVADVHLRMYTILKDDKFIGRFGIARDITELKKAEKIYKMGEEQYKILFKNIPIGVFYYNKELHLTEFNECFIQILQSTREKLLGLDLNKLKDQRVLPAIRAVLEGKEGGYTGYYTSTTGNATVYAHLRTVPIFDEDNQIIGGVGIMQDLTEQHNFQEQLIKNYEASKRSLEGTVLALASAVEKRDPYTAGHQKRVAQLACAIATELGLDNSIVESLKVVGILHDIGKIYVPAEILSKPSRLTEAEFSIIKEHPGIGAEILKPIEFPWPVSQIVLQHHERIDGSGYPFGLKDKDILLEAKILMVADVVEAMVTHRPYRPAWGIDVALEEVSAKKGIFFDPVVVECCIRLFREKGFNF